MITEKQKKAVTDLCRYVENYCEENGLEAFMTISASEDHPNGLEQMAGSIVTGRGDHIMGAISGVVKTDKRVCMLLSMALMQAQIRKADINVALSGGKFEHELMKGGTLYEQHYERKNGKEGWKGTQTPGQGARCFHRPGPLWP